MVLAMGAPVEDYTALDWACIVTAVVTPLPALVGAIRALWRRDLGPGGRWPQPTIAALLGNASWLLFGLTEYQEEPFWLNAWGGGIQAAALLVFLGLSTPAQRMQALRRPIRNAALCLAVTFGFGISRFQLWIYQSLCTGAGWIAAGAPLYTLLVLTENADDVEAFLPPRICLAFYAVHGFLWTGRGMMMMNGYMLTQNLIGFCSSAIQLLLHFSPALPLPRDITILQLGWYQVVLHDLRVQAGLLQEPPLIPQGNMPRQAESTEQMPTATDTATAGGDPPENLELAIVVWTPRPLPFRVVERSPSPILQLTDTEIVEIPPAPQDVPAASPSTNTPVRRSSRHLSQSNPTARVLRSQARDNQPTSGGESSSRTAKAPSDSKRKQ